MGELLSKMFLLGVDKASLKQIEEVAEGAATMQEQHARDAVAMAEIAGIRPSDARVQRAMQIVERLR